MFANNNSSVNFHNVNSVYNNQNLSISQRGINNNINNNNNSNNRNNVNNLNNNNSSL